MISRRKIISNVLNYTLLIALGVVIIYPFLWLIGSSFKTSTEIFSDPSDHLPISLADRFFVQDLHGDLLRSILHT